MRPHPIRSATLALLLALAPLTAHAKDKPKSAPKPKNAIEYPAKDVHLEEHVTVAALPCLNPKSCDFFRNHYLQNNMLPIWVIITNDREQPLTLDDVRILLLPAAGDRIQAASQDDLNRRLFSPRKAVPKTMPIIPIPIHHEPVDEKITNDDTDFGFKSLTVEPHATVAGYLFYDIAGLPDPVLKGAQLYLKELMTTDDQGKKLQLFAFTIPLDTYADTPDK